MQAKLDEIALTGGLDIHSPDVVEDWQQVGPDDRLSALRPVMARFGIRASLTVPVLLEGRHIGGLSLASTEPRSWPDQEVDLVEAVGRQLGSFVERLQLTNQIREQAARVQQIVTAVPEGLLHLDASSRIQVANPVARRNLDVLTDWREGGVVTHLGGRPIGELLSPPPQAALWHEVVGGEPPQTFEVIAQPIGPDTETTGSVLVLHDITEERRLEGQMWRQERLAAVGQLAGGVAHDFNNVLTSIQGYTDLVLGQFVSDDPRDWPSKDEMLADLREVSKAGERAAGLTRQLLAFSRQQILQPRVLDLNALIVNFQKMLRRLIGENIELITALSPSLGRIEADPGQLEQVIMNLAVNARDAMPDGGQLTLETANVELDEAYASRHFEAQPGRYVMLAVSDTGIGMDEEVQAHLFEPFFTTKEKGKGTGLGLATIYGIVKQSGGHIGVYSEPGVGTTFKVYLPWVDREADVPQHIQGLVDLPRGAETVLVVEDDEAVQTMSSRILQQCGYIVLEADHPETALLVATSYKAPIHLLVTDVVMPGMNGRELAGTLASSRPEMKVLYVSGYTDNAIVHHGVLDPDLDFLQKPYRPAIFAARVRQALDASP